MRLALAVLLALTLARPALAGSDDAPQPLHHHPRGWYSAWGLVIGGGAVALVGVGLTTRSDPGGSTAGWSLAGIGTATWVAGALVLKLTERRALRRSGAAY
jgi:hypothetical protein